MAGRLLFIILVICGCAHSPETDLLAKHFLIGDTDLPEDQLMERWQHLGNQIQVFTRDWNCNQPQNKEKVIHPRRIYLLDKKGSQQVQILLGIPTIARNHRHWDALTTLAEILGAGSGGRLFQDLRERQGLT